MLLNTWNDYDEQTQAADDAETQRAYAAFCKSQNALRDLDNRALGLTEDPPQQSYYDIHMMQSSQSNHDPPGLTRPTKYHTSQKEYQTTTNENYNSNNSTRNMQQTLLLVRQRLRAARLQEEQQSARRAVTQYGNDVTAAIEHASDRATMTLAEQIRSNHTPIPVTEATGLASAFPKRTTHTTTTSTAIPRRSSQHSKQNNSARDHTTMSLAEQIRSNHTAIPVIESSGLASAFPKRNTMTTNQLREELIQRKNQWNEKPSHGELSVATRNSRGRRVKTTVESFGGLGLGESLASGLERRRQQQEEPMQQQQQQQQQQQPNTTIAPPRNTRKLRARADISDFGGSLGDILETSRRNVSDRTDTTTSQTTTDYTNNNNRRPSQRHAQEWAGAASLYETRRRTEVVPVSAADFGGSLSDVMPPVPGRRQQQQQQQQQQRNRSRTTNTTNDDHLLREFMTSETNQAGSLANHVHSYADHRNTMREEDMSYDALLALDQGTTNRRITVAQRSKETSPDELFKQIRTTTYRSKKKIKKKTEEAEEEDDECAICLCEFEHRESVKKWPCQHFFHVKCTKVKNERKKNSFFNYH
jgi:hypothetical protein